MSKLTEMLDRPGWDRWISNEPDSDERAAVMWMRHVAHRWGRRIDVHKFVQADAPGFFHSHVANAIRMVVAGGYVEEVYDVVAQRPCGEVVWRPGSFGIVRPGFVHRVARLLKGPSFSIWFRGRVTHPIRIYGEGVERAFAGSPFLIRLPDGGYENSQFND